MPTEHQFLTRELEQTKLELKDALRRAKEKPITIKMSDLLAQVYPEYDPLRTVALAEKDSHLYPGLIAEAYKLLGLPHTKAMALGLDESKHEYQHGAAATDKVSVFYGVRFFRVVDDHGRFMQIALQSFTASIGSFTVDEAIAITSAPDELSKVDEVYLSKLRGE